MGLGGRIRSYTVARDRHIWVDLDEVRKLREPKKPPAD
jgi:hypothetical protein